MKPLHGSIFKNTLHTFCSFAIIAAASNVRAIDTDIYLNQSAGVLPNVMFSIDTSGSMGARMYAAPDYNRLSSYSGSFDSNRFYVSPNGRIPAVPSGLSAGPMDSLKGCQFADDAVNNDGFTGIRTAFAFSIDSNVPVTSNRWIPGDKVSFSLTDSAHVSVECSDDSGTHGAASGGGGVYASDSGALLYTNNAANEVDWSKYPFITVFSGNYLNYRANPPSNVRLTREIIQKRVIRDAVKRTPDIMAGLTEIYYGGGHILQGLKDNSIRSNQEALLSKLNTTRSRFGTPLSGSLLEVLHYYHGKNYYRYRSTDPTAMTGNRYISPITSSCQKSYVILVTDGYPCCDSRANNVFRASSSNYPKYNEHTGVNSCFGNCLDEMTEYLSKADASTLPDIYDLDGDSNPDPQTVKVYPIGMEINQQLLDDAAAAAGTDSYYAKDAVEFENAFVEILATIKEEGGVSMVTAASSNDRFSKTSNREYLYYGQFVPSSKAQWRGNLKKYRYAYDSDGVAYITDTRTSNPDISTFDGRVASSAISYWSNGVDGNEALQGGVADRLKTKSAWGRNIYGIHNWSNTNQPVMLPGHKISDLSNSFLVSEMNVSGRSTTEQNNIIKYVVGQDVKDENSNNNNTEQRGALGAIVRSSPIPIQFGGTQADPKVVVFVTTTDGMLHAFDDKTGDELWSIVMPEAYSHFSRQYDNPNSSSPWWGIDGSMTARVVDNNENGVIEAGDKVMLYISAGLSMRRWFMIDVTNALKSSAQATLVRRGMYNAAQADWQEFGFATSNMVVMSYRLRGDSSDKVRKGMVYANGWDPDAEFSYGPSSMGRGLTLHDADDGSVLWKMINDGPGSAMKYAFPTQPTVVDIDGDGYTDLIYAIDVNANIWRFNVNKNASSTRSMITGGKFASLGANTDGNRRRAYKRLDAAVIQNPDGVSVMLAVGTGDRMNPLSQTDDDRLYVITDKSAASGVQPSSVLSADSDFYDATDNKLGQGSPSELLDEIAKLNQRAGWYIKLPSGQKSISAPLISAGIVNFPVYQIGSASLDPCRSGNAGSGVLYRLDILDATPIADYNEDDNAELSKEDRVVQIRGNGIPGDVGFHTSAQGVKTIIVNMDTFINRPDIDDPSKRQTPERLFQGDSAGYWFEN